MDWHNISIESDSKTARTNLWSAQERAANICALLDRPKKVIELCVGPSLKTLEAQYELAGVQEVWGNDIDPRWQKYYPLGKWMMGDARKLDLSGFDVVVVAPPLSKGCSGRREDSLRVDQVLPSYYEFLHLNNPLIVFVLPGRTLSIREDREQMHKLMAHMPGCVDVVPLSNGAIRKYVDLYWRK